MQPPQHEADVRLTDLDQTATSGVGDVLITFSQLATILDVGLSLYARRHLRMSLYSQLILGCRNLIRIMQADHLLGGYHCASMR